MCGDVAELRSRLSLRRGCAISFVRNGQEVKQRTYKIVSHLGPAHGLGVYNSGVDAVVKALLERYFFCWTGDQFKPPLVTSPGAFTTPQLHEFRGMVVKHVKREARVYSALEVVDLYTGPKRQLYMQAYHSLLEKALSKRDSVLSPFPKFEKQDLGKAPRIIQPRTPRYNLRLGRYLKGNEKLFYEGINKAWGRRTPATVIKGFDMYTAADILRQKWEVFSDPVAVSIDAVKYDMHVTAPALKYEHSYYTNSFDHATPRQRSELSQLLSWQVNQKGVAYCDDGRVKFSVVATRASGDMNTSLGNCLLMCSLVFAYCKHVSVDAELGNNGDDCVVIMERADSARFIDNLATWFGNVGFRMGVDGITDCFERLEFCQSQPVWDGARWRMLRNPLTCMIKDPICLAPVHTPKGLNRWRNAVGMCGLACASGMPVMQSFYRCIAKNTTTASKKYINSVFRNTAMQERIGNNMGVVKYIADEARVSFYEAFGVTVDMQLAYECYYDNLELTDDENHDSITTNIPIIDEAQLIFDKND